MSLIRILGYFLSEATASLWRSWKVSLLAILTIAMSIFIGGTFMLLSGNLESLVDNWRRESRILVYLRSSASEQDLERLRSLAAEAEWIVTVDEVSGSEAVVRFREMFPSLEGMLEGSDSQTLPASLEMTFDAAAAETEVFDAWLDRLRGDPAVVLVDDDRDWLRQLDAFVTILKSLGLVVGGALLVAAVVTIASVIRLTAYLYRDEISVMRMVGATEFYIRGPFFCEGLIQGFLGGGLALLGLYAGFWAVNPRTSTVLLGNALVDRFLSWQSMLALLALASAAGLLGAVLSLRRESLATD